jgi:hypothetical protein
MAVAVHCRGCGTPVPETASYCYLCKCPNPAFRASHVTPKSALPGSRAPSPNYLTPVVWAVLVAVSLMFAAAAAAGVVLALSL